MVGIRFKCFLFLYGIARFMRGKSEIKFDFSSLLAGRVFFLKVVNEQVSD